MMTVSASVKVPLNEMLPLGAEYGETPVARGLVGDAMAVVVPLRDVVPVTLNRPVPLTVRQVSPVLPL